MKFVKDQIITDTDGNQWQLIEDYECYEERKFKNTLLLQFDIAVIVLIYANDYPKLGCDIVKARML